MQKNIPIKFKMTIKQYFQLNDEYLTKLKNFLMKNSMI